MTSTVPDSPDPIDPDDPRASRPKLVVPGQPAPVLTRLLVYALDCALLAAALMPLHFLVMYRLMEDRPEWTRNGLYLWFFVLATYSLPVWLYFILFESRPDGATLGKRLAGIRVVTRDGGQLSVSTAIVRTAFKLLPWEVMHATLMLPIPAFDADHADVVSRPGLTAQFFLVASWLITVLLTEGNRGVHDFLAGTFVVRKRGVTPKSEPQDESQPGS